VSPESWCREDYTCQYGRHIKCGASSVQEPATGGKTTKAPETSTKKPVTKPVAQVDDGKKKVEKVHQAPQVTEQVGRDVLNHSICIAINAASWCKENGFCHGNDNVRCKGVGNTRAVPDKTISAPPALRAHVSEENEKRRKPSGGPDSMILWVEWPTLEVGGWPEYFANLLAFVTNACGGIRFHRLVMRVLHPEFQRERGKLWQISETSAFYTEFLSKLPRGIEVYIYPYLLNGKAASSWSDTMGVSMPIEGAFKYAHEYNKLLIRHGHGARIFGIVTDKEEGRHFEGDLVHLRTLKDRYTGGGAPRLRFGMTLGFDCAGSIPSLNKDIDDIYLEMYDFYQYDSKHVVPVEPGSFRNDPHGFSNELDRKQRWSLHFDRYRKHEKVIFMWSLQSRSSNKCMHPMNDNTCGERDDFGTWTPRAFRDFLSHISSRESVFKERQHALFQYSVVPHSWHPHHGTC
jgi:hypothetical protein